MAIKFSAVVRHKGKETGRSVGMTIEEALALVRRINRSNQDETWNAWQNGAYIEETQSVKHLPVNVTK
jgi:hypothetical protein